jgi:hypothetical protein
VQILVERAELRQPRHLAAGAISLPDEHVPAALQPGPGHSDPQRIRQGRPGVLTGTQGVGTALDAAQQTPTVVTDEDEVIDHDPRGARRVGARLRHHRPPRAGQRLALRRHPDHHQRLNAATQPTPPRRHRHRATRRPDRLAQSPQQAVRATGSGRRHALAHPLHHPVRRRPSPSPTTSG